MFKFVFGYMVGRSSGRRRSRRQERIMYREIGDLKDPSVQEYNAYAKQTGILGELHYLFTGRYLDE